MFAAYPDGSALELLGVHRLYSPPLALLDDAHAVVSGTERWERVRLDGQDSEPYVASTGTALDGFSFLLSPSRRLALELNSEGFAILDATTPAADAVLARRPYSNGISRSGPWLLPAWSRDSARLAIADNYDIAVIDVQSGAERLFAIDAIGAGLLRDSADGGIEAIVWTPDHAIRFATRSGLWHLDLAAGTATKVADPPRPGGFAHTIVLAYAPDGRTLVVATEVGLFVLDSSGTWRHLTSVGADLRETNALFWAPDSSAVLYAGYTASLPEGLIVAPVDGSGAYRLVAPFQGPVLGWLPDGRVVWVSRVGGL
jgi:hypothetical protein